MKQIISIVLALLFAMCISCSKQISGDPEQDAQTFIQALIEAAKKNDFEKANEITGLYYEYYSNADVVDKTIFLKHINYPEKYLTRGEQVLFEELTNDDRWEDAPNTIRFLLFAKETENEARRLGIWE